jgi:hypothetical protein
MSKGILRVALIAVGGALLSATVANAQLVIMPDSTNNRLVGFDPFNGSLVNSNMFGLAAGTPIHAIQVGSEIWVSEQVGDRISRWDLTGTALGAISGGLDNIRGMQQIGNTVYVTNAGTANGAPGAAVVSYDLNGNPLGFFATPQASSPFGILSFGGNMLVSSSNANDDVHIYSLTGTSLGTFHNSTTLNFAEQLDYTLNGDIIIAGFSSNNVVRFDTSGNVLGTFAASGARGVYQLGNGNILWSSGAGVFIYDVVAGTSTQVYTGGGRYLQYAPIPEPGVALVLMGAAGLLLGRRRVV